MMHRKNNSAFWLEAIGILVGGYSLFSLTNSIFEFGLSDFFSRLSGIYRLIFHPIVNVAEPALNWLAGQVGWTLPAVWRDFAVFYFVVAGGVMRVHARSAGGLPVTIRLIPAIAIGISWVFILILFPVALVANRDLRGTLKRSISHYKEVIAQILNAFLALLVFLVLNAGGT